MKSWSQAIYLPLKAMTKHQLARVACWVIAIHIFLLTVAIPKSASPAPDPVKLLTVKTVRLAPGVKIADRTSLPKPQAPQTPASASPPQADPNVDRPDLEEIAAAEPAIEKKIEKIKTLKPEASPKKTKENPKEKTKKTSKKSDPIKATKPSSSAKKNSTVDTKKLADAMKNLKQVQTGSSTKTGSSATKKTDETAGSGEATLSHEEAISQFLRLWVRLPEYGQVKIELTLDSRGHVVACKTLASESETNRIFVEERLPRLIFPVDRNQAQRQANKTFTLVMRND